jgi:hypothetical protein
VKSKVGQNRVFWGRQAREVRRLPMRHESALSLEGTALRNPPIIVYLEFYSRVRHAVGFGQILAYNLSTTRL